MQGKKMKGRKKRKKMIIPAGKTRIRGPMQGKKTKGGKKMKKMIIPAGKT